MCTVQELCSAVRRVRADVNIPPNKKLNVRVACSDVVKGQVLQFADALKRLASIDVLDFHAALGPELTKGCAMMLTTRFQVALPLEGILDVDAEKVRLQKELEKADKEVAGIRGRLDNEGFRARAPKDVIEKDEARAGEITQRMQRLKDTLARLG